ncbi:hypothetical protein, variant [Phialophora macrospora]|uniref:Transcription factor domain-containing protein n=1 Tax=Phialophora macrospora TaxID=1851006 RepID=A0A0D2CZD4_9EURO|nr:hypothetical protein, variant [Phialophora macrospora]
MTSHGPPPTFILGYPQTRRERAQSRSAIKANASRARWRKDAVPSTAEDASPPPPTTTTWPPRPGNSRPGHLVPPHEARQSHDHDRVLVSLPRHSAAVPRRRQQKPRPQVPFYLSASNALNAITLPLPVPFEQLAFFSAHEIRRLLQQLYETLDQVLPANAAGPNEAVALWIHKIMSDPGCLSAYLFAQLMRNKYNLHFHPKAQHQLLRAHAETVTHVNRALSNPSTACNDVTILTVFTLAYHYLTMDAEVRPAYVTRRAPQQGPLRSLRLLNLYGGPIEAVSMHREGLFKMIELRGGLDKIILPGLAGLLCYADVIVATRTVQQPRLPFTSCVKGADLDGALSRTRRTNHPLRRLGRGFAILDNFGSPLRALDLQIALHRLSLYTLAVDDYLAGRSVAQSLSMLGEERTLVMHSLMGLTPGVPDLDTDARPLAPGDELFDLCHLAALIYSVLCVLPLPAAPLELLVHRTRTLFARHGFAREWAGAPTLMLWSAFMAGMAALGVNDDNNNNGNDNDKSWFVGLIRRGARELEIRSFEELKERVLLQYLWFPTTNDGDGSDLWAEVDHVPRIDIHSMYPLPDEG